MRIFIIIGLIATLFFATSSFAGSRGGHYKGTSSYGKTHSSGQTHVKGYTKKDGTYVQPHYRTSPNSTKLDNWSSKGNINPHTGKEGTEDPLKND